MDQPRPRLPTSRSQFAWIAAGGAILVVVGLLLIPFGSNYLALWFGEVQDFCHVPVFAFLALVLGTLFPQRRLWALLAAVGIAAAAEFVQPLLGRSTSLRDALYGILGAGMAAAWLQKTWPLSVRLATVAVLVAWPVACTGPAMLDAALAWRDFPVLAGTGSPFERQRWLRNEVRIEPASGTLRLTYPSSPDGSCAILFPIVRDWTAYDTLEIAFEFEGSPLKLLISVRDGKRLPPETPRFDLWSTYPPGRHVVRIELDELLKGDGFPPIETDRIQSVHVVAYSARVVELQGIRLLGKKNKRTWAQAE